MHVRDVCQAFIAGLEAPADLVYGQSFNVGILKGNYTVRELAEAAQRVVPGSELIFQNEDTDPRTYRVNFSKILSVLKDYYRPEWDLLRGGVELVNYFDKIRFREGHYNGRYCNRLKQLGYLQSIGVLDRELRWC